MAGNVLLEQLSDAEFDLFRRYIYDVSGIHLSEQKKALLSNRLRRRLRELGLDSYRAYYDLLRGKRKESQEEMGKFLSAITTNETYFFRNDKLWDFVADELCPWFEEKAGQLSFRRKIRFWSAASSTGEEAYTFVIQLREKMKKLDRFQVEILATDLSERVLKHAAAGIYSDYSVNKVSPALKKKYWTEVETGSWKLNDDIRSMVEFKQHNLRDPMRRRFDVIFLRNVMIYFDVEMKKKVMAQVLPALEPDGYIVIGDVDPMRQGDGLLDHCPELEYVRPTIYRKRRPDGAS